ncbi:MAG: thioredoxin domain-containing protein [Rhodoferax sp.]|nr:thioredoxin domain-containing protein [Rhodoferax sp.]MCB2028859.1 thioredoxin domain-containing protein [Rhodoferax sp.]
MMRVPAFARSRRFVAAAALALLGTLVLVASFQKQGSPAESPVAEPPNAEVAPVLTGGQSTSSTPAGPPWRYGRADARFTVVEYADLECPFCRAYFAVLKRWIDAHPEANWQWHHLPLSMHEPAATAQARVVECVGQTGGSSAFWQAVEWVYTNTRGEGRGLPEGLRYPGLTAEAQHCLDGDRPDAMIRAQAEEAAQQRIAVTPTLKLQDNQSGKTLLLHGPVEGDALLSAIDLLAAGGTDAPTPKEMPADAVGMPR